MKIILISGFLGAGKTSFVKSLSENTKEKFVILENEFGELNLDGEYLRKNLKDDIANEVKIWELTQGCICCSVNLDLTHSVLTIANTLNPDYLIIEPSGIAMTSNIIKKLNKISYERIELGLPIVIIDAHNYKNSLENFKLYLEDQLNYSGLIVVSKSENMCENDFLELKKELNIKESTQFPLTHYSRWSEKNWQNILDVKTSLHKEDKKIKLNFKVENNKKRKLEQISFDNINIESVDVLFYILLLLTSGKFGNIERAKGYFSIENNYFKFDLVGKNYAITGCEKMSDERVVIIGENLEKCLLKNLFKVF
ncbi:GTP-binding protein [Gemella cuniculi]|uniref:GTP-binding protein n=1 Tax=Gemella cuniculi TaxID=150240 RepID=UPI0004116ED9|nr:GTP-binding protein [Gemella cuniculi]